MIQSMRKNAAIIMWVVIVAFVATIVFAWGMDLSGASKAKDSVGKVNGKDISLRYFEKMVSVERDKQREQYQGAEVPAYQSRMVPRQVWETEVSRILLKDAFDKMGIGASGDEIFEYIKKNPPQEVFAAKEFKTNNVFDTAKFVAFLNNPAIYDNEGMQSLERYTKDFLVPMQSLRFLLSLKSVPSKEELAYEYKTENEKAVFEYAVVNSHRFVADPISDSKVVEYYQAHQDSFKTQEQADLYFIKIPKVATAADERNTYQELVDMKAKINNSDSNFAEEARLESDDEGSTAQGGDLGWVSKGVMVPEFDSVVFTIAPQTVSEPVKTRFGYHLLYVEARETKDGKVQAKVRHILRKIMPSGETIDKLSSLADSLHAKAVAGNIKSITPKNGMVIVDSTGLFKRGDMMPRLGYIAGAGGFTFLQDKNAVSELLENDEGFYILQVKQKIKKGILPLDVAKEKIVQILSDESRKAKARAYMDAFVAKVANKDAVSQYSQGDTMVTSGVSDTVTRTQYVPGVGMNNQAVSAAFVLPVGKVSPIIESSGSFCVVKPLWHKPVTDIPWNTPQMGQIEEKLMKDGADKNYYDWYMDYKSKAKIEDNVNQFYID